MTSSGACGAWDMTRSKVEDPLGGGRLDNRNLTFCHVDVSETRPETALDVRLSLCVFPRG